MATKKKCKAKNAKDKCLVYEAKHTNPEAAKNHTKKLKDRGATVKRTKKGNTIILNYSFKKK